MIAGGPRRHSLPLHGGAAAIWHTVGRRPAEPCAALVPDEHVDVDHPVGSMCIAQLRVPTIITEERHLETVALTAARMDKVDVSSPAMDGAKPHYHVARCPEGRLFRTTLLLTLPAEATRAELAN